MELKDIKELMKVLKKEEMYEIKVRYGKVKLTIKNSEDPNVENIRTEIKTEKKEEQKIDTVKEEIVKSPVNGVLKEILVSDQAAVDFAKPLFIIEVL